MDIWYAVVVTSGLQHSRAPSFNMLLISKIKDKAQEQICGPDDDLDAFGRLLRNTLCE